MLMRQNNGDFSTHSVASWVRGEKWCPAEESHIKVVSSSLIWTSASLWKEVASVENKWSCDRHPNPRGSLLRLEH